MRSLILLAFLPGLAFGQAQFIELTDGSAYRGNIVFAGEDAVITTTTGEKVLISVSKLKSVSGGATGAPAAPKLNTVNGGTVRATAVPRPAPARRGFVPGAAASAAPDINQIQNNIMGNPQVMAAIMALSEDPELMRTIQDPAFLALLMSGDLNAIERSPKFKKVANHKAIRAIMEQVKAGMPSR